VLHQTGYSVVRSLSEAPNYASVIANILNQDHSKGKPTLERRYANISMQGMEQWTHKDSRTPLHPFYISSLKMIIS